MTKCYLGRNSGHIDSFCIRLWCLRSNSDLQFSLSSMQLHVWKNTYGFFTRQGVSLSWKNNDGSGASLNTRELWPGSFIGWIARPGRAFRFEPYPPSCNFWWFTLAV